MTEDQDVRREALDQALRFHSQRASATAAATVATAKTFEAFLKGDNDAEADL